MRENVIVVASFIASAVLSVVVFNLFGHCQDVEFYVYDGLALLVGAVMIWFSFFLIRREAGHKYVHYVGMIVGATMITTHTAKLLIGQCV